MNTSKIVSSVAFALLVLLSGCTAPANKPTPAASTEATTFRSVARAESTTSITAGDRFLYADAPARAGYPNSWTVLENIAYESAYDETYRNPAWVAYHLSGPPHVAPDRPDPGYPMDDRTVSRMVADDYPAGYDHGHCASNMVIATFFDDEAQLETFKMTNMLPQTPRLNRGPWKSVETLEYKKWATSEHDLWVICGPVYTTANDQPVNPTNRYGTKKVCIPVACFKVVMRKSGDRLETLAFIIPQDLALGQKPAKFLKSIREVERRTGLNFFSSLPQSDQDVIENAVAAQVWP